MELPVRWKGLPPTQMADSIWPIIVAPLNVEPETTEDAIVQGSSLMKQNWFVKDGTIRLAVALHAHGGRAVIMSAGVPARLFNERTERNMLRFLNSFEKE
jgi:hypothetical protein